MTQFSRNASLFVALAGGDISAIDEHGVVVWQLGLTAGKYPAKTFYDDCPDDCTLEISMGITVLEPSSRLQSQDIGEDANKSGANPDFVVTSATRNAREMEHLITSMRVTERKMNARLAAVERMNDHIEKRPKGQKLDDPSLVDSGDIDFTEDETPLRDQAISQEPKIDDQNG